MDLKGANQVAYAVDVPQATSRAPHQSKDHRYYKRSNFESKPMEDYEVRDAMRRSIDYGRQYVTAWDLNVEIKRLISAAREREQVDIGFPFMARDRLIISVSDTLRSAGHAIILLEKSIRQLVGRLLQMIDEFNSVVETVNPGQQNVTVSQQFRRQLLELRIVAEQVSGALTLVLEREP
jgi:hypothetical protein